MSSLRTESTAVWGVLSQNQLHWKVKSWSEMWWKLTNVLIDHSLDFSSPHLLLRFPSWAGVVQEVTEQLRSVFCVCHDLLVPRSRLVPLEWSVLQSLSWTGRYCREAFRGWEVGGRRRNECDRSEKKPLDVVTRALDSHGRLWRKWESETQNYWADATVLGDGCSGWNARNGAARSHHMCTTCNFSSNIFTSPVQSTVTGSLHLSSTSSSMP